MATLVENAAEVANLASAIDTAITTKGGTLVGGGKLRNAAAGIATIQTGSTATPLTVTANGTYTAPSGSAYSPVTVDVSTAEYEGNDTRIHIDLSDPSSPLEFYVSVDNNVATTISGTDVTDGGRAGWNSRKVICTGGHKQYIIIISGSGHGIYTRSYCLTGLTTTGDQDTYYWNTSIDHLITLLEVGNNCTRITYQYAPSYSFIKQVKCAPSARWVCPPICSPGFNGKFYVNVIGAGTTSTSNTSYATELVTFGNSSRNISGDECYQYLKKLTIADNMTMASVAHGACSLTEIFIPSTFTTFLWNSFYYVAGEFKPTSQLWNVEFESTTPPSVNSPSRNFTIGAFRPVANGGFVFRVPASAITTYAITNPYSRFVHHLLDSSANITSSALLGDKDSVAVITNGAVTGGIVYDLTAAASATTVYWPLTLKTAFGTDDTATVEAAMVAKNYTISWVSGF